MRLAHRHRLEQTTHTTHPTRNAAERAANRGEKDHSSRSPSDAVAAPHVKGVVPLHVLAEAHSSVADGRHEHADHHSRPRLHVAGAGSDGDEAGDGAGQQAGELGLAGEDPVNAQPADGGGRGGEIRVDESEHGDLIDSQLAASVEAVPAEPQEAGAEREEGDVVGLGLLLGSGGLGSVWLAVVHENDAAESRETGSAVHDNASGEVTDAVLPQPAAAPDPVAPGHVDEGDPENLEHEPSLEVHLVTQSAGDERGCDDGEHELVHEDDLSGREREREREGGREGEGGQREKIEKAIVEDNRETSQIKLPLKKKSAG